MGEYAELAFEQDFMNSQKCEDVFGSSTPFKSNRIIWVTRDGSEMDIRDMETSHIKFSITKCKRDKWRLEAIPYLEAELNRRNSNADTNY